MECMLTAEEDMRLIALYMYSYQSYTSSTCITHFMQEDFWYMYNVLE